MRTVAKADVDVTPRWALWLVAVVCLGPVTIVWLTGALLLPFWIAMRIGFEQAGPERFDDWIWEPWPFACVGGGFVGLMGVLRLLTLSGREPPRSHRLFTAGAVTVGLAALAVFNLPWLTGGVPSLSEAAPITVYAVLSFTGTAWLLAKSRKLLLASPVLDRSRNGI
jgi:hypothetical protein